MIGIFGVVSIRVENGGREFMKDYDQRDILYVLINDWYNTKSDSISNFKNIMSIMMYLNIMSTSFILSITEYVNCDGNIINDINHVTSSIFKRINLICWS